MKFLATVISVICYLILHGKTAQAAISKPNPIMRIGVVQRFGEKITDKIQIKPANQGDKLTLTFLTPKGKTVVTTPSIDLGITIRKLPKPLLDEHIVLSYHRSFETAENSAQKWRSLGIEVEITQPNNWQVWAKRSVYNTPLLRRWLWQSLEAQGYNKTTKLETKILSKFPQIAWKVNGYFYQRSNLEIQTKQNLIQIKTITEKPTSLDEYGRDPNLRIYPGSLQIERNSYGSYTIINNVNLESYLRGVVPHEIESYAAKPALKAQAILARTYTLRNKHRFAADNYNLCATTHCQVYQGLTEIIPSTDEAIKSTANQVLTYQNQLIDAVYSSSNGGVTAKFDDIWYGEDRPYLPVKLDAIANVWDLGQKKLDNEENVEQFINQQNPGFTEQGSEFFRWQEASSLPLLAKQLKEYLKQKNEPLSNLQRIDKMSVIQRSISGRVLKMQIQTDLGMVELEKDEIHDAFWSPLSTLFYLKPEYNPNQTMWGYIFVGGGYGHGVGMSQTGAKKLAALGWSSEKILQFYFPGSDLQLLQ